MRNNYSEIVSEIRQDLKKYIVKSDLKALVIGVSGGIDSALVCAIAKPVVDELGIPLIGRSISIQTNKPDEEERARNIGSCFCTDFTEVDLKEQYLVLREFDDMEDVVDRFDTSEDVAYKIRMGNIKARMRMIYLYNIASKRGGIVLGTENKTEENLGFCTIHGDAATDLEPIKNLWKTEVYGLSQYLATEGTLEERNALTSCIECNATDGLGISNTDLDQILPDWKLRHQSTRTGYGEVDEIFISYFELIDRINHRVNAFEKSELMLLLNAMKESPVIQRFLKTDFKRNHPYVIKLK